MVFTFEKKETEVTSNLFIIQIKKKKNVSLPTIKITAWQICLSFKSND